MFEENSVEVLNVDQSNATPKYSINGRSDVMSVNQKKRNKVNVIIYKQLQAREVYKLNKEWKELYQSFSQTPHGVYFYTLDKDAIFPFYIGMCIAKTYYIIGRVWEELDDYCHGLYWLPKDVFMLKNLDCFKNSTHNQKDLFYEPVKEPSEIKERQQAIENFMSSVFITFGKIESEEGGSLIQDEEHILIRQIEAKLQNHLVKKLDLKPNWIGDGGQNFAKVNKEDLKELSIILKDKTDKGIKFLDVFKDI
ncbi:MAG: hypothetical protein M1591_01025 [Deltaproteobacteria bacterium]|nr:hypothetical protein [Deltaproteobacteria bacterium]